MANELTGVQLIEQGLTARAPMHLGPAPDNQASLARFEPPPASPSSANPIDLISKGLEARAAVGLAGRGAGGGRGSL